MTVATSGIGTSTCPEAHGLAWQLAGQTLTATATDNAGNTSTATTTIRVNVTAAGVCGLVKLWVDGAGNQNSLCVKLDHRSYGAAINELNALAGKKLSTAHAQALIALIRQL